MLFGFVVSTIMLKCSVNPCLIGLVKMKVDRDKNRIDKMESTSAELTEALKTMGPEIAAMDRAPAEATALRHRALLAEIAEANRALKTLASEIAEIDRATAEARWVIRPLHAAICIRLDPGFGQMLNQIIGQMLKRGFHSPTTRAHLRCGPSGCRLSSCIA